MTFLVDTDIFETAVLMRECGVHEIMTADTDFLQFSFLQSYQPVAARL